MNLLRAILAAVLALVVAITGRTQTAPPSPTPAQPCDLSRLHAVASGGGPAMGQVSLVIRLRNPHPAPCTLRGWPRIDGLDAHGESVAVAARSKFAPALVRGVVPRPAPTVTLGHAAAAYLVISGTDIPVHGPACLAPFDAFRASKGGHRLTMPAELAGTRFPNCARIYATPFLPASLVIPKDR